MANSVFDTMWLQQRLMVHGADTDNLVNPDTRVSSGVLDAGTVTELKAFAQRHNIPRSQVAVTSLLKGRKVRIEPPVLVEKLLASPPAVDVSRLEALEVIESEAEVAAKFPVVAGNVENLAKRVAANVIRAEKYAQEVSDIAKAGKATQDFLNAYNDWYKSATELQKTLANRLEDPAIKREFQKKLDEAGVDSKVMISALLKGPLAVAQLQEKSMTGFEAFPLIAILFGLSVAGVVAWKSADVLRAWSQLKQESTTRELFEWKKECIKSGKCNPEDMQDFEKHRETLAQEKSPMLWLLAGAALTGIGLYAYSRRKQIKTFVAARGES